MSWQDILNQGADHAAALYRLYHGAVMGLVTDAINSSDADMPVMREALTRALWARYTDLLATLALPRLALDAAARAIQDVQRQMGKREIPVDTGQQLNSHVVDLYNAAETAVSQAAYADFQALLRFYMRYVHQIALMVSSGRYARSQAMIATRLKVLPLKDTFKINDQAGHAWAADRYVATTVRGLMVQAYADTFVALAASFGASEFKAVHPEADHKSNLTFNIGGWDEIRPVVFHPNSRVSLKVA